MSDWLLSDLAPGDGRSANFDLARFDLRSPRSTADRGFLDAYALLVEQFGPSDSVESVEVLAARLARPPGVQPDGWTLRYEMLAVRDAAGHLAAVRDHTAIVPPDRSSAIVHLSHLFVTEPWQRKGLAGWLRALPLRTARACLADAGCPPETPVTLVAEMEPFDPSLPKRMPRLLAYGRAGFREVDDAIRYHQPDFRPPAVIDATGGTKPVPYSLIIRRVGREGEPSLPAAELRALVAALYRMYADGCRPQDMAPVLRQLREEYPPDDAPPVRLFAPFSL